MCLGLTPALAHHALLPRLLREFRSEAPDVELRVQEKDTSLLCQDVAAGRIDAAFIRQPAPLDEQLRVETLVDEKLMLAVPTEHLLAQRDAVSLSELRGENFVMFDRALAPGLYDSILAACVEAGFSIRVVHHAPQKVLAMMLAAGGAGIALVPSSLAGLQADALRMVPIEGP